ncbi:putative aldouronate transport system permease protein [Anaerocolumna jejuensis DSM 15929]|uniref:Putative aldouronate transport system permease protein n=1 Tax=Anaerocolumna jejuensis DSM 15929 TaxID=1121322 RepID=A0A1M6QN61_9FIRM|nr:carbohydrate ABC transporter permease [Anaerocolumna jejuensis]SHK21457.1 putative aldouronate transport system permease protein [Anaerocolumna jejuensis DSM 15929]
MRKKKINAYQIIAHVVMIMVTISVILPFLLLFMSSITSEDVLLNYGYSFFPRKISLEAYTYILQSGTKILRAYSMTILVTAVGTTVSILIAALFAYPLSLSNLPFKKVFNFFVFFTMLFNGGLIPSYIMWTNIFHIKDTVWGLMFPNLLMNAMSVLMIRTYFANSIPSTLFEAAQIDGASQLQVFRKIVIPLGKPILVTMGTFAGLAYWNDWTNGLYYISKRTDYYTIQNLLNKMVSDLQFLTSNSNLTSQAAQEIAKVPSTGIQMAIAFIAILPILVLFPFLQKYYSKGIMLGAVKG